MNKIFFSIIILAIASYSLAAQTEATTNDGKKVLLNDDGTWEYGKFNASDEEDYVDCSDLILITVDTLTGKTSGRSINPLIVSDDDDESRFEISVLKGTKSIIISVKVFGAGSCIEKDGKMNILFRDYSRSDLINNGDFNCNSKFSLYFGGDFGKERQLDLLRTKEIKTMRIWTSEGYVEKKFSPEQSKQLMRIVSCIYNN